MRRLVPLLVALALPAAAQTAQAAQAAMPRLADADGLHVVSEQALDSRLIALTVTTSALPGPANIRILLPSGYGSHPRMHYPVLYLFDGTSGHASDWTTMGNAEQTTAGRPLIVVMPDISLNGDGGGWCTNWPSGKYRWETFHIDQLIPWIDHNLRTIATRAGRAIAGLSQGGFCSTSYAARHPDLFLTALSYSGAPDIAYDATAQALAEPVIEATAVGLDGEPAFSMFGDPVTEELNWHAHDPATLAANLRGMNLLMYTGNGLPGPLDTGLNPAGSLIEGGVSELTLLFHNRLQALGIPSLYDPYGPGTHSWPYWARDLSWSIGPIMNDFAHPLPAPNPVYYTSAAPAYSVFGWSVAIDRAAGEMSTLSGASAAGFTLAGSGTATVTTPAQYKRHTRYRITISNRAGTTVTAERTGRTRSLMIHVVLGPSNPAQQYTVQAGLDGGTKVYAATVAISR
jgi:S-formylglutathione hydrolase FrmB